MVGLPPKSRELKHDTQVDPTRAEALCKLFERDLRVVKNLKALIDTIGQHAPALPNAAKLEGIVSLPLTLFAE